MKNIIKEKLAEFEVKNNIKILFAVESGSRAWGFEASDSDYDVRFVYTLPTKEYLKLSQPKDTCGSIEGDFDFAGWEIRKALNLMFNGNFTIREWLQSPIVYKNDNNVISYLKGLAEITPCQERLFFTYRSMLKNVIKNWLSPELKEVNLKKYFYALRAAFAMKYIETVDSNVPPMVLGDLMASVRVDLTLLNKVVELIEQKKNSIEMSKKPRIIEIDNLIFEMETKSFTKGADEDKWPLRDTYNEFLYKLISDNNAR